MTLEYVANYIDKKINENPEFIKFTFYELRIKENLSEADMLSLLSLSAQRLINNGYTVYRKGQEYFIDGKTKKVDEELIAIKRRDSSVRKTVWTNRNSKNIRH